MPYCGVVSGVKGKGTGNLAMKRVGEESAREEGAKRVKSEVGSVFVLCKLKNLVRVHLKVDNDLSLRIPDISEILSINTESISES